MIEIEIVKLLVELAGKLGSPTKNLYSRAKYGYSQSDVEILEFFYTFFDRPAFSVPFTHEMPAEFMQSIEDTVVAINVGLHRTRDGEIISRGKGKSSFESPVLRVKFDAVSMLLVEIRHTFDMAVSADNIIILPEFYAATNPSVNQAFDDLRNEILAIINPVFEGIGKLPFPAIVTDPTYESIKISYSGLNPEVRYFYREVLKRQPPLFPMITKHPRIATGGKSIAAHSEYNEQMLSDLAILYNRGEIEDHEYYRAKAKIRGLSVEDPVDYYRGLEKIEESINSIDSEIQDPLSVATLMKMYFEAEFDGDSTSGNIHEMIGNWLLKWGYIPHLIDDQL